MSKIKNGGLDQYGAGLFAQQQFGTAGVEGVKPDKKKADSGFLSNSGKRESVECYNWFHLLANHSYRSADRHSSTPPTSKLRSKLFHSELHSKCPCVPSQNRSTIVLSDVRYQRSPLKKRSNGPSNDLTTSAYNLYRSA